MIVSLAYIFLIAYIYKVSYLRCHGRKPLVSHSGQAHVLNEWHMFDIQNHACGLFYSIWEIKEALCTYKYLLINKVTQNFV